MLKPFADRYAATRALGHRIVASLDEARSLLEGQFGWLLLIIFTTLLISGPGRLVLSQRFS